MGVCAKESYFRCHSQPCPHPAAIHFSVTTLQWLHGPIEIFRKHLEVLHDMVCLHVRLASERNQDLLLSFADVVPYSVCHCPVDEDLLVAMSEQAVLPRLHLRQSQLPLPS